MDDGHDIDETVGLPSLEDMERHLYERDPPSEAVQNEAEVIFERHFERWLDRERRRLSRERSPDTLRQRGELLNLIDDRIAATLGVEDERDELRALDAEWTERLFRTVMEEYTEVEDE